MPTIKPTLHNSIREQLIREVQDMPLEQILPSDRQLAKRFGVALLTINKVMQSLASDGYVDRIQGKGTILAARERLVQRDGQTGQGKLVVATPHYFSHEYWARSHYAEELARKQGCRTVDFRFGSSADCAGLLALLRQETDLRGVLISPVPGTLTRAVVEQLDELGVPVVIFFACPWVSLTRHVYSVVPDWFKCGYLGTRCLLGAGRRRLAYIANEPSGFDDSQMKNGIKQALYEADLRLKDLIRPDPLCQVWSDSRDAGYRMTLAALDHGADGLICASCNGAVGAYRAAWERQCEIPDQVSVVAGSGFDHPQDIIYMTPPLTTVEASLRGEMETAFELVNNRSTPLGRQVVSDMQLYVRASVAGNPSEGARR